MRLKFCVLVALLLASIGFSVVPTMAQINPPPQNDPILLTQQLRNEVEVADNELFKGFALTITNQVKSALIKKIDIVIRMFEKENFQGGCKKLKNDIVPKLNFCETIRVRALSWLSVDPDLEDNVYQFSDNCQGLIEDIIELADPRPTP